MSADLVLGPSQMWAVAERNRLRRRSRLVVKMRHQRQVVRASRRLKAAS